MMMADEIRAHRQQAEKDAAASPFVSDVATRSGDPNYLAASIGLALWVIAEKLDALTEDFAGVLDGGAITVRKS